MIHYFRFEFFRYFLASFAALAIDFIAFSIGLRFFEIPWPISATIGFILGVAAAYFLSIRFVFRSRILKTSPAMEFAIFLGVGIGGLLVTQLTLWVGVELLGGNPELSKIFAAGFTFIFNFLVRRATLFTSAPQHSLARQ